MLNNNNLPKAYATLVTNNSYINGAIVLGYSLRNYNTSHLIICLVTSEVDRAYRVQLSKVFDHVIEIPKLDSQDSKRLDLLGRPELGVTFSKLHVWNMTWLSQILFLDADTLVLKNIDHLFNQYENSHFAACPDIGWPDCFNSGVFMCKPSHQIYSDLIKLSRDKGSFDGGDQGLLNTYFNTWSKDQNQRIPFTYNVTPNAVYSYAPAYQQYQGNISVLHFIGHSKPWNQDQDQNQSHNSKSQSNRNSSIAENKPSPPANLSNKWWKMFNQLPEEITKQTKTVLALNQNRNEEKIEVIEQKNIEKVAANQEMHHNENYSRHPLDNIFKNPKQEPPHISSLPDNYFRPLESPPNIEDQKTNLLPNTFDSLNDYKLLTDAHQVFKNEPFPFFEAYKEHMPKKQSQEKLSKVSRQILTSDYHRPSHIDIKPNDQHATFQNFKPSEQIKQASGSSTPLSNPTSPRSRARLIRTKFNRSANKPTITDEGTYLTEYQVTVESDSPIDDNYLKFEPSFEDQELQLSLTSQKNDLLHLDTTNVLADCEIEHEKVKDENLGLQLINTYSIVKEPEQITNDSKANGIQLIVTQEEIIDDIADISTSHPVYDYSDDNDHDSETNNFSHYRIYWDQPQLKDWRPPTPKTSQPQTARKLRASSQSSDNFSSITFALDNLRLQTPKRRSSMKQN